MAYNGQIIDNPVSGERIVMQRTAASTGGQLLAFELTLSPRGHVPASHVHPVQEERFTIVSGRMRFRKGLRTITAAAGETVLVPPGTIHRFANGGSDVARALVEVRPAFRMEDLLETAAELAREGRTLPSGMPLPLDLALFMREFRQELRIPVLPPALVRAVMAPLVWTAVRQGLGLRYEQGRRLAA
ncbi:MAG: cupin domain-containing protein [Candidatus Dormibacteraceae bacterium]